MKNIILKYLKRTIACILAMTIFSGCVNYSSNNKEKQNIGTEEELLIFYEDGTENILDNFILEYPDTKVEKYRFGGTEKEISNLVLKKGNPDIILLNLKISIDQDAVIEEKYAASITSLYYEDSSIDSTYYFPGTFDIGKKDDEIYGFPLGISIPMMTIREENWKGSAFETLQENYTAWDLFNAIECELNREKNQGVFFSIDSMYGGNFYHLLQVIDGFQKNEEKTIVDEKLFSQIYALKYKQSQMSKEALEYWSMENYEVPMGICSISGLDPRSYMGNFIVSNWYEKDGAPQICLAYATSVNEYFFKEKTYALYYPTVTDGTKFGASVEIIGLVGSNSEKKERAYEALRLMMDTPIQNFSQPGGIFGNTFCPVNKENAYMLLENFEKSGEQIYNNEKENITIMNGVDELLYTIKKIEVGEEEKRKLQNVLNGISFLYRVTEEERYVNKIVNEYLGENPIENYHLCYLEFIEILNLEENR